MHRRHPGSLCPHSLTTCTTIFEVPANATGLIFIADDLDGSEDGAEIVVLGLSDVMPVRFNFPEEDVEVGDVCWNVLSVEELGNELTNEEGDTTTAQGRFLQTQFQSLSSATLRYDGLLIGG